MVLPSSSSPVHVTVDKCIQGNGELYLVFICTYILESHEHGKKWSTWACYSNAVLFNSFCGLLMLAVSFVTRNVAPLDAKEILSLCAAKQFVALDVLVSIEIKH